MPYTSDEIKGFDDSRLRVAHIHIHYDFNVARKRSPEEIIQDHRNITGELKRRDLSHEDRDNLDRTLKKAEIWIRVMKEQPTLSDVHVNGLEGILNTKRSKREANYRQHNGEEQCEGCTFFISQEDKCVVIKGGIEFNYTCDFWQSLRKEKVIKCNILRKDHEEQIAFAAVLVPDVPDTDDDTFSIECVEKAAHEFMLDSGEIGMMHLRGEEGECSAQPIESAIVRSETMQIGEEILTKGTWWMGVFVPDPNEWEMIKSDKLGAFSIDGYVQEVRMEL